MTIARNHAFSPTIRGGPFHACGISAVQSVKFLELLWAALPGYVTFDTTPAGWTLVGGALILSSTLWLARRESRAT